MAMSEPFTESEKMALLQSVIVTSNVPSHVLGAMIRDHQIQPPWQDIIIPQGAFLKTPHNEASNIRATGHDPGQGRPRTAKVPRQNSKSNSRTLRQCQTVFQEITSSPTQYRPPLPAAPRPPPSSMPPPRTHPTQSEPPLSIPGNRQLQPRPPGMPAYSEESPSSPYSPTTSGGPTRRRGRPNKAEAERRQQIRNEALARGDKDPFPTRHRKRKMDTSSMTESVIVSAPPPSIPAIAPPTSSIFSPSITTSSYQYPVSSFAPSSNSGSLTLAPILSTGSHDIGRGLSRTPSAPNITAPGDFAVPSAPHAPPRPPSIGQFGHPPSFSQPEQQQSGPREPRSASTGRHSNGSESSQRSQRSQSGYTPGQPMEQ